MVITFSVGGTASGPRPIDPGRDFPQLAALLKAVFADELDSGSHHAFEHAARTGQSPFSWRLDPFFRRLTPGYVWVEDGRIVGNVTLLASRLPHRYLVANVAVDAAYRRRGIAHGLMEVVHAQTTRRGGSEIRLQVEKENHAAKSLYRAFGYKELGSVTNWRLAGRSPYQAPLDIAADGRLADVRELPRSRWRDAYLLDQMTSQADLEWPDPLPRDAYRQSLLQRVTDFLSGKHAENWAIMDPSRQLLGIGVITSDWGRAHQLRVRVHPHWRGELETALAQKLVQRVHYLPRRSVRLLHDDGDEVMNEFLPKLQFQKERVLTQMVLTL